MKCTHQGYMLSFTLFIYFCIIVKKKTSMVVIENQLGLSSETSKKNLTTGDENVLIEEIFKFVWKDEGIGRGEGILLNEKCQFGRQSQQL